MRMAIDVACGMEYLNRERFIHRDLAARNVFLTKDMQAKIGDFGLSREHNFNEEFLSNGGLIAVRWTAVEAIRTRRFTQMTDVWSYGILLYEIWTKAELPYKHIKFVLL